MRVRIYELAKELNIGNKEIVSKLSEMGVQVKSPSSSIETDLANRLKKMLHPVPGLEAEKTPVAVSAEKPKKEPGAALAEKPRKKTTPPAAKAKSKIVPEENKIAPAPAKGEVESKDSSTVVASPATRTRVEIEAPINVRKLAEVLEIKAEELIQTLMKLGVMATINQNIDQETAEIVAHEFDREITVIEAKAAATAPADDPKDLVPRAPVVTFMGHIDHGKTSLLDSIRESKVAVHEAGGITQHIGAYEVELNKGRITFLDTPGHETFTAMRARGANVTDIAVLVVAADDGVMPQTREALDHARAAKVPIVVAINKMDKPGAAPDRVKRQLMELELAPEEYGGQTICCEVSAVTRQGLDHLLEMLLLQSEMLELKANPKAPARAVIIEARMDKERGAVATALVKRGTLRVGDVIVCGLFSGKVKALYDYRGEKVREAGPATPVEVLGLGGVSQPGQELMVVESEREAKEIAGNRRLEDRVSGGGVVAKMTLEELFSKIAAGKTKELRLILKGDVQGSVEALREALRKLSNDKVSINVVRCAVGDINENDVMLASASDAVIIGFHTRIDVDAKDLSRKENVEIKLYDIIYEIIEDVRKAMEGLLEPTIKETILGRAEVRQLFRASKGETVAGSVVVSGKVTENAKARVIRGEKIVHEGTIVSLRRFKDSVREVKEGMECGIRLLHLDDLQEGDNIEVFKMEKVPQKL
ncbi:MAG: translation initiation factor IF-2 [Candidatus Aureabacteria bacterium]|nr:translation initiation factor IF-2 [Candidatus Auribacterota bacterium]